MMNNDEIERHTNHEVALRVSEAAERVLELQAQLAQHREYTAELEHKFAGCVTIANHNEVVRQLIEQLAQCQQELAELDEASVQQGQDLARLRQEREELRADYDLWQWDAVKRENETLRQRVGILEAVLLLVAQHFDTMMGDGSGMPFETFLTQTGLIREQVKEVLGPTSDPTYVHRNRLSQAKASS
jgi:lipid II:glycine glycyltransferase (peptidoglycan interpeptide bridge formation enzyme)